MRLFCSEEISRRDKDEDVEGEVCYFFFFHQMELQTGYLKIPPQTSPAPNSAHWLIVSGLIMVLKQIEQCFNVVAYGKKYFNRENTHITFKVFKGKGNVDLLA